MKLSRILSLALAFALVLSLGLMPSPRAEAARAAVIVLDPDDDIAHAYWPGEPEVRELELSYDLATQLKDRLETDCRSEVILTRAGSPGLVSRATRKAVAVDAAPDLMVTLAFNAYAGSPWGVRIDGGPEAYARLQDVAFGDMMLAETAAYTGRAANGPVGTAANLPWYPEYGDLNFPWVHLETLFLDHNYDYPVIQTAFDLVVDGVYAGIRDQMEAMGLTCGSPYPARPSAAELERLRDLGYQNYLRYGADPVSMSTGNFVTSEALFSLTGVGEQVMDFELTYNAQSGLDSPVGYGWVHPYASYTQLFDDDSAGVVLPDGRTFLFEPDGVGGFVGPDDAFATLTANGDGSVLTWRSSTGETRTFAMDPDTGRGHLTAVVSRAGEAVTLSYDGPGALFQRLSAVTDEAGQTVTVTTDGDGRITSFQRPDGAVWLFERSTGGDLVALTRPGGGVSRYDYDVEHRMTAQTAADGVTWLRNEYDVQSRVVRQTTAMGYARTLVFDDTAGTTTYTDAVGAVTVYHWNADHQVIKVVDALGQESVSTYLGNSLTGAESDSSGTVTSYEYDAAGQPVTVTDSAGGTVRHVYNSQGDLIETIDRLGQSTQHTVDAQGRPVATTYPDGSTATRVYDAHGDLVQETDQLGRVTAMTYDARGNLTSVTDPLGHTVSHTYDLANRQLTVTDQVGAVTAYEYDADDHVTAIKYADGSSESCVYDINGKPTSLTGQLGQTWTYEYDAELYLSARTAPDGGVTRYEYDREQRLTRIVQADGSTISYTLDALGRQVVRTDGRGQVAHTTYDAGGRVASQTDEAGFVTTYSYDARGLLIETTHPDGGIETIVRDQAGRVVSQTDPLGGVTSYVYDWQGDVVATTDPLGRVTAYVYDAAGQLLSQTDPAGAVTGYAYDAAGRTTSTTDPLGRITRWEYDSLGRVLEVTDAAGFRAAAYTYDAVGNVITAYEVGAGTTTFTRDLGGLAVQATDVLDRVTTWSYDPMGRAVEQTDPTGAVTRQTWDQMGELTSVTDASGTVTLFGRDGDGNLVEVIENVTGGGQTATTDVTTSYAYDARGLLASVTDPVGGTTSYEYSATGLISRETDPVGNVTDYTYDLNGNLATRQRGGITTVYAYDAANQLVGRAHSNEMTSDSFSYDLAGRQTTAVNHSGTVSTVYDLAGQIVSVTDVNGKTIGYTYDPRGLRTAMTLPDGAVMTYQWDSERRNTSLTTALGVVAFTYDAAGRQVTQSRPNGNTVRTSYTLSDQIDRVTTSRLSGKTEKILSDFDYTYDLLGNVIGLRQTVGTDKNTLVYTYDALGRLTGSTSSDRHQEDNVYVYDAAGNRISWTHGADLSKVTDQNIQTNTYDLAGRLVSSTEQFWYSSTIQKTRRTVNTWTAGNLTRSVTEAEWATVIKGKAGTAHAQWTDDRRFVYDAENQLLSATQWGVKTVKGVGQEIQCVKSNAGLYGCPTGVNLLRDPPNHGVTVAPARNSLTRDYDALGRAVSDDNGGLETVRWVYDGLDPVYAETTVTSTKKTTVTELIRDSSGRLLGQNTLASKLDGDWFLTDALGSVHAAVTKSGATVLEETSYSDWGVQLDENELLVAYSGELRDPTQNGLVNFHARAYQPVFALWHQPDPAGGVLEVPGSVRGYTYVLLNPLTFDELYGYVGWKTILGAAVTGLIVATLVIVAAPICVASLGVGCVVTAALVGGATAFAAGNAAAIAQGSSPSQAARVGASAGVMTAGAILTGGGLAIAGAGLAAGGGGLALAGGGSVGVGSTAGWALAGVGAGAVAAGYAGVAYSRAYGRGGDGSSYEDDHESPIDPRLLGKRELERLAAENGFRDAHAIKRDALGKGADVSKWDIRLDPSTHKVWVIEKNGLGEVFTDLFFYP
jgi:RHS repeat-associated protein